jgi:putative phosphoribosyl transferase
MPHFRDTQPIVLALPRGGVPVGFQIAAALGAPLDVIVTRKLGTPRRPELALGAIAEGLASCVDLRLLQEAGVSTRWLDDVMEIERCELHRDAKRYREGRPFPDVYGRPVVLVDDGLSTGVTLRAAARALRLHSPERIVLALPVCAPKTHAAIACDVDDVVLAAPPAELAGLGTYEDYFSETDDAEVLRWLAQARDAMGSPVDPADATRRLRPRTR